MKSVADRALVRDEHKNSISQIWRQNISQAQIHETLLLNFGFCHRVFWNVVLNLRAGARDGLRIRFHRHKAAISVSAGEKLCWSSNAHLGPSELPRGFLCDEARPVRVPVSLHSCSHVVYHGSHYCSLAWTSCQAPGYQPGHVLALLPLQRNKLYSLHCRVFSRVSAQVSTNAGESNPSAFTFICFHFPLKEFVS